MLPIKDGLFWLNNPKKSFLVIYLYFESLPYKVRDY